MVTERYRTILIAMFGNEKHIDPTSLAMQELPEGCHWQHANFDGLLQMIKGAACSGDFQPDPTVPIQIQPSVAAFQRLMMHLEEG